MITPVIPPSRVRIGAPRPYFPRTHEVPPAPAGSPRERLLALSGAPAHREPAALTGPADPVRAADELLDYLRASGYRRPGPDRGAGGAAAGPPAGQP